MAKYTIGINLDNAAFEEAEGVEVARILMVLASNCIKHDAAWSGDVRDINGNAVGVAHRSE